MKIDLMMNQSQIFFGKERSDEKSQMIEINKKFKSENERLNKKKNQINKCFVEFYDNNYLFLRI